MTQVDFMYLQAKASWNKCSLLVSYWRKHNKNNRVFIHTDSEALAKQMDDLIWTYKPL